MTSPTDIVQTMYAAYGNADMDALKDTLSDDIVWIYHGTDEIEHAGTYQGKDGVMGFFDDVNAHIDYLDFQPTQFLAQGSTVVVLGQEKQKIRRNGEILEQGWVQIFSVNNGQIDRMEEFSNTAYAVEIHTK